MLYLRLFEQETKLAPREEDPVKLRGIGPDASIMDSGTNGNSKSGIPAAEVSPYDKNLAVVPYKGTTIHRKTLRRNQLKYIPREFASNDF